MGWTSLVLPPVPTKGLASAAIEALSLAYWRGVADVAPYALILALIGYLIGSRRK